MYSASAGVLSNRLVVAEPACCTTERICMQPFVSYTGILVCLYHAHTHVQVEAGSDDEQDLFASLPATEAAAAAAERRDRQLPLLALSKGYRQHRVTLDGDRTQYDDATDAGGRVSPGFDLHSVADSMRQVGCWHVPCAGAVGVVCEWKCGDVQVV